MFLDSKTKIPPVQKVEHIRSFGYFRELNSLIINGFCGFETEAENNYNTST